MDALTVFLLLGAGYCILLFFDAFFKSCCHYPYLQLLDGFGLKISFLAVKWKTKALNRLIMKWGNTKPSFWRLWFDIGIFTTSVFIFISLYVIFSSGIAVFFRKKYEGQEPLLIPVVPGVNLPLSELPYYSVTLLICSVVHELGHALAAGVEDIGILELGCNLYFILPVAYVSLPTDKITALSLKKRLSVFSAGVWHNIVLSFMAYLLYCSLPSIFSPFFDYGNSVSVSRIAKDSPLKHTSKGLFVDDVILRINNCPILNEDDWYKCLSNKEILIPSVCIHSDLINRLDESVPLKHIGNGYVECCDPKNTKNLCFEYINIENNELELPGHVCLPGRTVMEQSTDFCNSSPYFCSDERYCFKPILPNNTYLFKIVCKAKNVIYLGHPSDFYQSMEVTSYVKKNTFLSVSFPKAVTKLVKYVVVISLGLAFVNTLPFIFMDGEYILQTLALLVFKNKMSKRQIMIVVNAITWTSTPLLVIYLVYSVVLLL